MALINTGNQAIKILEGYSLGSGILSGYILPNIEMISPQAIVPDGTAITFNVLTNVSPSSGSNGDIWYNKPSNILYKKITGVWTILTDRVVNTYYSPPVQNLDACPI